MKLIGAIVLIGCTCACASSEDFVGPAKRCAQKQLADVRVIDAPARQLVATKCAEQIRNWAIKGLEAGLGHAVDLNDTRSKQEVLGRQQVALRLLVPLKGDPLRM